jgi:hypothetical protein
MAVQYGRDADQMDLIAVGNITFTERLLVPTVQRPQKQPITSSRGGGGYYLPRHGPTGSG